jgi:hypothetical protein
VLIADERDSAPFLPSNGANDDSLQGGQRDAVRIEPRSWRDRGPRQVS